ncbi:MAG: malic enzyme-like NAD(P)-binding protein, partial [Nitrosopumilaceae archaeon]
KMQLAGFTNQSEKGQLSEVIKQADVFIGVSGVPNLLKPKMIRDMNENPIIFAITNPEPEIDPRVAKKSGAKIIATGSFKYENKVNNALVFPFLMRAILDLKIQKITRKILYTTAVAIAKTVPKKKLSVTHIIPSIDDKNLQQNITKALKLKT